MLGHVRSVYDKLREVNSGLVRFLKVGTGYVRLCQFKAFYIFIL
jgi:hypothetical protein